MSIAFKSKIAKVGFGMLAATSMLVGSSALAVDCYQFTSNLRVGSRGEAVRQLQMRLNSDPATKLAVAAGSAGSAGFETTTFGPATRTAVMKYQAIKGFAQVGNTGPMTRAALNASCGSTPSTPTTPTTTGPVSAMLATTNPAAGTIIAGQATANLAQFTFNGTGTVTSVTLQRTGVSANDTLQNVYLYDGATRLTDAASVTSAGTVNFSNPAGLFMVNGSKTISVRADIKASASGQTVGVNLTGYTVSGMSMTAASLMGNIMSVASAADLATAIMPTTNTVVGTPSVDAGTSNYTVWGNTLNIAQRTVMLKAANFRVIGSAETGALQNARLIVDGAQVGAAVASVTANSTLSFDLSNSPVSLTTGAHTIEVRADVVGGANRSFYLSLQNAGDLMLTDSQYGVNVMLQNTGPVAFTLNSGASISISAGTLALAKDTTFNSTTTVTSGATNVTVGKYTIRAYGEAVKVMQVTVDVDLASGTEGLNNLSLYANGAQVGSSQNTAAFTTYTSGADANTVATFNLGSALIVPAGQTTTLEVKVDTVRTGGSNYTGTITTIVAIPVGQAQGQTSWSTYPTGTPLTSASTVVTAGAATANITPSSSFLAQNVGVNAANVRVGSYVITAGTTEGLRVTNLAVSIDQVLDSATTGDVELTDIANLRGTVTVSGQSAITLNSVNPQATNNFSTDFTIPAGSTATVDIFVDVTNATAGETIQTNLLATARGASSNVVLATGTGIASAQAGQEMTVGSGTISNTDGVTIVSTSATSQRYVMGGSSVEPIIRYNVKSTSGAVTLEEFTFAIAGSTPTNVITALSVQGTTGGSSCSVAVPSGASTVTVTGCSIPVAFTLGGTDIIVTPTINVVGLGSVQSTNAKTVTVDLTGIEYSNGTETLTVETDGTSGSADLSASNAIRPVASLPTLTLTPASNLLTNGEVKIATVTVSASAGGNITLSALPVTVNLSGATIATTAAADDIIIREGSTTIVTADGVVAVATTTSQAFVVTFTNTETVIAGSSRTFDIYAKLVAGVDVAGDSASVQLSPSSAFLWNDVNGGGTAMPGTHILNYPTNSVSVTR